MRAAKELFQSSPEFKNFQAIVASTAFEPACNAALLCLIEELPEKTADPSKAWDCYLQIVGARRFIDMLSQLHVPPEKEKRVKSAELDYGLTRENYRP